MTPAPLQTADPLTRILREQAACRAYLDGDGEDKAGAWAGLCDWVMEETILRLEGDTENEQPFRSEYS